jgi:dihydroorotase-like cyclic amidohydrolase
MLTQVAKGRLSIHDLVRLYAANPARIWGIDDRKGHLDVGADADFVLVDPTAEGIIAGAHLHSKHPVTPYDGWATTGAVEATYLRGELIAEHGEVVGAPRGRHLAPRETKPIILGGTP